MKDRKCVFKPWFAWNPAKIEDYLEEMAASGWMVEKTAFSLMWFQFIKNKPKKVRYCMDYQWKPEADYVQIMDDDGWRRVDDASGWILWEKKYSGSRPHIYTDKRSLIDRNKKIITVIIISLMAQIPPLSKNAFETLFTRYFGGWSVIGDIMQAVYFLLVLFVIYGLIRLLLVNRSLQAEL